MTRIQESVEVDVPVRTAYDQWTQFEDFPRFMEGVKQVVQLDDTRLRWTAEIGGEQKTWEAKIVDQDPDREIKWASTSGARNDGTVRFESLDADRTRVELTMEVEPEGAKETVGTALQVPQGQVKADLERFKAFIEGHGAETGAWRGEVHAGMSSEERSSTGEMGSSSLGTSGMSRSGSIPGSGSTGSTSGSMGSSTGTGSTTGSDEDAEPA